MNLAEIWLPPSPREAKYRQRNSALKITTVTAGFFFFDAPAILVVRIEDCNMQIIEEFVFYSGSI